MRRDGVEERVVAQGRVGEAELGIGRALLAQEIADGEAGARRGGAATRRGGAS